MPFVVKRPFRDGKGFHATGSIVRPGSIDRLKSRIRYGNLMEVNEQNFNSVAHYFKSRHNITLDKDKCLAPANQVTPEEPATQVTPEEPAAQVTPEEPAAVTAKAVVKASQ